MSGTRGLLASIGASVALVAAAALSLLAVSAVFAFGGWQGSGLESVHRPALVFEPSLDDQGPQRAAMQLASATPVVLPSPPARKPQRAAVAIRRKSSPAVQTTQRPILSDLPARPAEPAAEPAAHVVKPVPPRKIEIKAAEGVRSLGGELSATVQSAGQLLGELTAPLGPPVSDAVQEVLNLVAALLRRTTSGVGGVLDRPR